MKRPKLLGHIRAPYSRLRAFFRSRLPSSVLTTHAASTPRQPTRIFAPPQENENIEGIVDTSIRNGENSLSPPEYTHGTVSFDTQSTRTFAPSQEHERFERIVKNSFRNGENSPWPEYAYGTALFDTGSKYNLVTRRFLRDNGFEWQPSISTTNLVQMNDDKIEVLGELQGRWYPVNALEKDNFRPRFEITPFKVVDSNNFDLIIGRITINELGLLLPNPSFFGAFIPEPIRVDPASITTEMQQGLERRRQNEQEEMRKVDEEKKAEEEKARKAKASNSQSR